MSIAGCPVLRPAGPHPPQVNRCCCESGGAPAPASRSCSTPSALWAEGPSTWTLTTRRHRRGAPSSCAPGGSRGGVAAPPAPLGSGGLRIPPAPMRGSSNTPKEWATTGKGGGEAVVQSPDGSSVPVRPGGSFSVGGSEIVLLCCSGAVRAASPEGAEGRLHLTVSVEADERTWAVEVAALAGTTCGDAVTAIARYLGLSSERRMCGYRLGRGGTSSLDSPGTGRGSSAATTWSSGRSRTAPPSRPPLAPRTRRRRAWLRSAAAPAPTTGPWSTTSISRRSPTRRRCEGPATTGRSSPVSASAPPRWSPGWRCRDSAGWRSRVR